MNTVCLDCKAKSQNGILEHFGNCPSQGSKIGKQASCNDPTCPFCPAASEVKGNTEYVEINAQGAVKGSTTDGTGHPAKATTDPQEWLERTIAIAFTKVFDDTMLPSEAIKTATQTILTEIATMERKAREDELERMKVMFELDWNTVKNQIVYRLQELRK